VVAEPLPGDEQFTGMLTIPYLTRAGTCGIKFRNLAGKPKFLHHAGQKARLYNAGAYFTADDTIGVAEGEIDAITASEHLGVPTIGIPGAEGWRADIWGPLFKDFRRVIVFADGDDAGRRAAARITETVGWRALTVQCPDGEDISSMIAAGRAGELLARIQSDTKDDDD
jgi:DNA primase